MGNTERNTRSVGMPDQCEIGEELVVSLGSYAEAQAVVRRLAERGFPVATLRIAATDLVVVERVLGRISLGWAAADGASTGAAIGGLTGFFFGLLEWFAPLRSAFVLAFWGIVLGAAVGTVIGAVRHWSGAGRRDHGRIASLEAGRYDILAPEGRGAEARRMLGVPPRRDDAADVAGDLR